MLQYLMRCERSGNLERIFLFLVKRERKGGGGGGVGGAEYIGPMTTYLLCQ